MADNFIKDNKNEILGLTTGIISIGVIVYLMNKYKDKDVSTAEADEEADRIANDKSKNVNNKPRYIGNKLKIKDIKLKVKEDIIYKDDYYYLIGLIYHLGNTIQGGHYITKIKRNGVWYEISDSNVNKIDDNILTHLNNYHKKQYPYLLFYKKNDKNNNTSILNNPKGITNCNNTCFANAVLQNLLNIDEIQKLLYTEETSLDKLNNILRDIFNLYFNTDADNIPKDKIIIPLKQLFNELDEYEFKIGDQSDAQEFFILILQKLFIINHIFNIREILITTCKRNNNSIFNKINTDIILQSISIEPEYLKKKEIDIFKNIEDPPEDYEIKDENDKSITDCKKDTIKRIKEYVPLSNYIIIHNKLFDSVYNKGGKSRRRKTSKSKRKYNKKKNKKTRKVKRSKHKKLKQRKNKRSIKK